MAGTVHDPKEITDFTGLSQIVVAAVLQHLSFNGMIQIGLEKRIPSITITDPDNPLIRDIVTSFHDVEDVIYSGFDDKEKIRMRKMLIRINDNLKARL